MIIYFPKDNILFAIDYFHYLQKQDQNKTKTTNIFNTLFFQKQNQNSQKPF